MAKTLVTGATGFLGSAVARQLAKRGDDLRLAVRETSNEENLAGLDHERVRLDVLDRRSVRRGLKDVERVFHVAGMTSMLARDATRMFAVNVEGTRLVLEEALTAGVERVVYTSSAAAIGPAEPGGAADETQIYTAGKLGIAYVNSKHEAEAEAMRIAAHGLEVVSVNPTLVFGAGDRGNSSTAIVRRFLLGRVPAYLGGAVNVVDVEDVAAGHLLADERGSPGERYILGNRNYTFERLFADLARLSGVEQPPLRLSESAALRLAAAIEVLGGRAPFSIDQVKSASQWWTYRNTKAKRELGWKTSPHEDTVEATINWWVEREGERLARARRSQPFQYKLAAAALDAAAPAAGLARRVLSLRRGGRPG